MILWNVNVLNKTKGQTLKRVLQENKVRQNFRKTNISDPLLVLIKGQCSFAGIFDLLCFLVTPISRLAFLPYYRLIKCKNCEWFESYIQSPEVLNFTRFIVARFTDLWKFLQMLLTQNKSNSLKKIRNDQNAEFHFRHWQCVFLTE